MRRSDLHKRDPLSKEKRDPFFEEKRDPFCEEKRDPFFEDKRHPLFQGPRSLVESAAKYMCEFKDCDMGTSKRARKLEGQGSGKSALVRTARFAVGC